MTILRGERHHRAEEHGAGGARGERDAPGMLTTEALVFLLSACAQAALAWIRYKRQRRAAQHVRLRVVRGRLDRHRPSNSRRS